MNKPQILVVEDDVAVGNLIATTLETQNYQFHRAKTGAGRCWTPSPTAQTSCSWIWAYPI